MANRFTRLVRFENEEGGVFYGDVTDDIHGGASLIGHPVHVFAGNSPFLPAFKKTSHKERIHRLLPPLPSVPGIIGVGLNYRKHIEVPQFPAIFSKPSTALAGPEDDIHVHAIARLLDYEGELCVVIGRDCKNISEEENPLDYVLGYTIGNDVSSRYWQAAAVSSGQADFAKGFDGFAPVGPVIASPAAIPDPSKLTLTTHVNGEERQRGQTDDLIFDIPYLIRFLSTGHTLTKGTIIMTDTPSGVIAGMKSPTWLKSGDVVEVEIDGIGRIKNKMVIG
ncbi:fumarylacetoacetate hydrolase family protein [Dactylonectria macrodidyma]|uniref:Fumarylacetoacetate hydrolase family protein n=1 Tax=Dactylonectria macrodidyma TaxID=307937 RepID=A0A9P9JJ01_9HYPO|nr:fumarylacetoacetate hydrolase family protein [Dactylonectria macrodidyma]